MNPRGDNNRDREGNTMPDTRGTDDTGDSRDRQQDVLPVTLYDYGVGNLHSIKKALEHAGAQVTVTQDAKHLLSAPAIVLPGVGAFGASMKTLTQVRHELRDRLEAGTPCLAVCIGMQLLFESSEESPGIEGIGLIEGNVKALPAHVGKIPHLGWNTLEPPKRHKQGPPGPFPHTPLDVGTYAYFVHSYHAEPREDVTLLATRYGEDTNTVEIPAVITKSNTLATQFHPEKSSTPGLSLIQGWVDAARLLQKEQKVPSKRPRATPQKGPDSRKKQTGPEGKP